MNWGNKLLVTFIVFGAGMGVLVYKSMNTTYELVEKDYYKKELRYQEVIDGSNRANALSAAASLAADRQWYCITVSGRNEKPGSHRFCTVLLCL